MEAKIVVLADVVSHKKEFITIDDDAEYKRCRVKLHRQGIVIRDNIRGSEINTKKQQVCKTGQLLVAEIDAKVGGYGIVPKELNGAIVSSHYYLFEINAEKIDLHYLENILKTDNFFYQIKPQGTTNYASIRPKDVLNITIPLPSLKDQENIAAKLNFTFYNLDILNFKIEENTQNIKALRESILEEAVQGKLVPQDHNDEPANMLLKKFKVEKEQLIKAKKIKREKPLPEIMQDLIPYELAQGWEWVRLGDICDYIQRGKSPEYSDIRKIPVISQKCIQWNGFDIAKAKYINPDTLDKYDDFRRLLAGDLLWNSTGLGTLGRINVYPSNIGYRTVVADSHVTVIRPTSSLVSSEYLYYWFSGPTVQGEINEKSSGSTKQTELNTPTVVCYLVPLPPFNEQIRIVEKVSYFMALCDQLDKIVEQSKQKSEVLVQAILQKAFQ